MLVSQLSRQNIQALLPINPPANWGQWHDLAECERISHFADVSTFGQRFKPLPRTATSSGSERVCQLCWRTA